MTDPMNFVERAIIEIDNDIFALQGEKNIAGELTKKGSFLQHAISILSLERGIIVKYFSRRIRDEFLNSPNFKE